MRRGIRNTRTSDASPKVEAQQPIPDIIPEKQTNVPESKIPDVTGEVTGNDQGLPPPTPLVPDTEPPLPYSHGQLLEALYWIQDVFERANMQMFLVYSTAEYALAKKDLDGDRVEVGVRLNEWNSGSRGIIDAVAQYEENEEDIIYYRHNNGVPVVLYVFEDDPCLLAADQIPYQHEYFKVPNPYDRFKEKYGK